MSQRCAVGVDAESCLHFQSSNFTRESDLGASSPGQSPSKFFDPPNVLILAFLRSLSPIRSHDPRYLSRALIGNISTVPKH